VTLDSWTVYAFLCDGTEPNGEQCNAVTDDSENIPAVRIMAEEDRWLIDGDTSFCPKHRPS